jgi:hypothetical protein
MSLLWATSVWSTGFVAQIIGFVLSHPEYTVGDDRGPPVEDHGVRPPKDMEFLKKAGGVSNKIGKYEAGLVAKSGYYRIVDGKPGNVVRPTITCYMLVNGYGVSYAMYGTAYTVVRDLVTRAERLRVRVEVDGKTEELKGCTLGKYRFTSKFETRDYTYPVPVVEIVGRLGEAGGPTLAEWRTVQPLRQAFKEGGEWTPMEALDPPAPPELPLPSHRGSWETPKQGSISVNDNPVPRNEDPPPPDWVERNWERDDGIDFDF